MDDPPITPNAPARLEYSAKPRLGWISRHRWKLIFLSILIAIAAPLCWYWTPLKLRFQWLYWSRQAAAFQMPAQALDPVVDDPLLIKRIASVDPGYVLKTVSDPSGALQFATYVPRDFRTLRLFDPRLNLTSRPEQPLIFMGSLLRPDGTPRLVIITGNQGELNNILVWVQVLVLPIPGWRDPPPQVMPGRVGRSDAGEGPIPDAAMVRTGITDPRDRSHIVFEFAARRAWTTINNPPPRWGSSGKGIIDAHLHNDDSFTFSLRSFSGSQRNVSLGISSMPGDVQTLKNMAR